MNAFGETKRYAADTVLATAGDPIRILGLHIVSGGTAGVLQIKETGATGDVFIKETGTANTGKTFSVPEGGYVMRNGAYLDIDSNTTFVSVTYRTET